MTRHSIFAAFALATYLVCSGVYAQDTNGQKELGVDISKAGTTKEDNQAFMNSLSAEDQAKVKAACLVQLVEPVADHPPVVVTFCKNLEPAT
jgi:hypothetical protein